MRTFFSCLDFISEDHTLICNSSHTNTTCWPRNIKGPKELNCKQGLHIITFTCLAMHQKANMLKYSCRYRRGLFPSRRGCHAPNSSPASGFGVSSFCWKESVRRRVQNNCDRIKKEPKRGGRERGCPPQSLCHYCRSLVTHEGINFPLKPKLCFITCEGALLKEPLTNMTTVFLPRDDTTNNENYQINDKDSDFIHSHLQMMKVDNEAKEFHPFLSNQLAAERKWHSRIWEGDYSTTKTGLTFLEPLSLSLFFYHVSTFYVIHRKVKLGCQ